MNMFAKNDANSVEEYLSLVPDTQKTDIDFLHDFIRNTVPNLEPYFASNMIGYGSFYYLDSKKKKNAWPIISLAYQKNYMSIYVCALAVDKTSIEKYIKDLGKLSKGISCIRFKKLDEINLDTLKIVLRLAEENPGVAGARMVEE